MDDRQRQRPRPGAASLFSEIIEPPKPEVLSPNVPLGAVFIDQADRSGKAERPGLQVERAPEVSPFISVNQQLTGLLLRANLVRNLPNMWGSVSDSESLSCTVRKCLSRGPRLSVCYREI